MTVTAILDIKKRNDAFCGALLHAGLYNAAKESDAIDKQLYALFLQMKSAKGRHIWPEGASYIWHTAGDDKVRGSHARNDGETFLWNNPPATGHPGEDYNCRCWAEPIGSDRVVNQMLITDINDNPDRWGRTDFINRYFSFSGEGVTLEETGHMEDFIRFYADHATSRNNTEPGVYKRVNSQLLEKALITPDGSFAEYFSSTYLFRTFLFSLGESRVDATFNGNIRRDEGHLIINGIVTYELKDGFADPLDLGFDFGAPYPMTATWQTKLIGAVKIP